MTLRGIPRRASKCRPPLAVAVQLGPAGACSPGGRERQPARTNPLDRHSPLVFPRDDCWHANLRYWQSRGTTALPLNGSGRPLFVGLSWDSYEPITDNTMLTG